MASIEQLQKEIEELRQQNTSLKTLWEKEKSIQLEKVNELKTSELKYQKLYSLIRLMSDTMPDLLWAKDLNRQFLFVNESMCKILLNASDTFEPIGKTDLFFAERERQSHPEDPNWHTFGELCLDSDAVTLKEMKPMQFNEFGNVKGEFLFLDVHKAPLINSKGELIGIVGSARDITKSKTIEEALKESESEYRNLVESMHEGLIVVDRDDIIHFVNPSFCSMLGYEKEELIGKIGNEILVNNDNRKIILQKNKERLTGINDRYELQFIKKNGDPIYILMNAAPVRDSSNNIIGSFATCLDITQQKQSADLVKRIKINYEYFFNSIGDFLFVLDTNGNMIHINNTVKNRLGYSDEELLGNSVLLVHPEERRDEAGKIVGEMLEGKAEFCPVPLKTKSSELIPVETRVTFGMWDDKPAIFGVTKDISAIRLSEEKFSKAYHLNPSACGFSDIETGVYIDVNDAFTALLGFTKDEVIGRTAYELGILTEESKISIMQNVNQNGVINNIEATLKAKNGEIKIVLLSAENMFIQDRQVRYTVVHDITQRKTYEKALYESNILFENVIKGTNVGTWKWNVQTGETEFNERWAEIVGYTLEELSPVSIHTWEKLVHPDDLKTTGEILSKVFVKSLSYYDNDCRMKHRNGSWIWVQDRGKVVEWTEDGNPLIMAGTHSDITDRKLAEAELEKYRKQLEELVKERTAELDNANVSLRREIEKQKEYEMLLKNSLNKEKELSMMKSNFISTASHEFRTPLTSILSSTEMLQRYKKRWNDIKKDEHYDRIKRQVEYLTKLLDDVLLISKTETGNIEYKPTEVNIRQLVEESLKEAKAIMNESHKVVKKYMCEKNTFNIDRKLMRFIIGNLLSNAIKFSPNGGKIEIKTDCNSKDLKITVSDQGIGLAQEEVNKIFQSFYRAANVGAISGTGLGLSIVNHAVELHGGKIIVKSELGIGTSFEVNIPLKKRKTVSDSLKGSKE